MDEAVETAGDKLMLPPQYENRRNEFEAALPKITV